MLFSPVYSDSWPRQEGLKICHININHIINKIDEISHILFSNNLDIFGVSESRLNVDNNDDKIQIPGYFFVERRDVYAEIGHATHCVFSCIYIYIICVSLSATFHLYSKKH